LIRAVSNLMRRSAVAANLMLYMHFSSEPAFLINVDLAYYCGSTNENYSVLLSTLPPRTQRDSHNVFDINLEVDVESTACL
jgi:hypothetical protein